MKFYTTLFFMLLTLFGLNAYAEFKHSPLDGIVQGMPYSKFRETVIHNGWQAIHNNLYYRENIGDRAVKMHEINGWFEVDDCSGTGAGFCNFNFRDVYGNELHVTTISDCYNDKGFPALSGEVCDLELYMWTIKFSDFN